MVATANANATDAAYEVLREGGSAVDAAITAQLVLNLVEPQSSGIGGGVFLMHYSARFGQVQNYDARETAPAAAKPDRFLHEGKPVPFTQAVNSGLSVAVPGLLRGLELAHRDHGVLPWSRLFQPAIALAEQGFPVSSRLHSLLSTDPVLPTNAAAAAYFYAPDGSAWPVGHILKNPEFATVLRQVAQDGPDAFYSGAIARDMVTAVRRHRTPGDLSEADLKAYRAKVRTPVCGQYRAYVLCGPPPPSSGPLAILQILGVLESFPMPSFAADSVQAVHYFSEAGRLAFADRDFFVGDPDFVDVPVQAMLSPTYLASRSGLIKPNRSMGMAPPGNPQGALARVGQSDAIEAPSTTHMSIVDGQGNIVSMTSTIENAFGSKIMVRGFLLNNEMTDFSMSYQDADGRAVANRIEPGKRPSSAMSPMIVFRDDKPYMVVGSPGGSAIINYVAKTLIGVMDWRLDIQQAIDLPNRGSRNKTTELEQGTALLELVAALELKGHSVAVREFASGLHGIVFAPDGLQGGADPRREGTVRGA